MKGKHCHDLLVSVSDYVDGNLEPSLCEEIEKHLENCRDCTVVVNTLRKTIDLYQELDEDTAVPDDILHRLFARLDLHNFNRK